MTDEKCLWKQAEESTHIIPRLSGAEKRKAIINLLRIIIHALQAECPCEYCHDAAAIRQSARSTGG
ncbi:hypothetical protein [Gallionella capsiferriformans]|uniref:Uncharacterized protein n=1 Tax=Gallionella capsiferriformans (strain ES-2) TaxID=395494 RepID=D9SHU9_GALCS|nr:hypothetical protein [Gallionella capsiferriformans]ADL56039.1 hypothetical protein Galf_2033 [Gallionella capsiferriformans ES-2]